MTSARKLTELNETEITIQAPWGELAAVTWGRASEPPVLLVHGKMDVCSGFRPLVARLPARFHYVSLECPGNGRSDPFPPNARFTTADYVPAVLAVKDHFKWDHFMYIGHSLGVVIGKYFDLAYPGVISRMVELDPVPAYDAYEPGDFGAWYHLFYGDYYRADRLHKYTASPDTAPRYTYEQARQLMVNVRGLSEAAADHVLERALAPAGAGHYRWSFDQRQREIPRLPLSSSTLRALYTSTRTPILCILASAMLQLGAYSRTPWVSERHRWPHRNYAVKQVPGGHDVHINEPKLMADDIAHFLLQHTQTHSHPAKL